MTDDRPSSTPRWIVALLCVAVALALLGGALLWDRTEQIADDDRAVACSTADLVAHVPAIQFEGESIQNFRGWIRARHDLLVAARTARTCDERVVVALEARIAADAQLLEEIERGRRNAPNEGSALRRPDRGIK